MAGTLLYVVTLLTALGFMLIGYDNGVMGGIINEAPFQTTFHHPSSSLLGTIVAIYEIGCCAGSIMTAFVGERLGRKRSIMIGAVVMLGGAGFQAGVSSSGAMIGARVVSGLGMGFLNSTMPVLQSEVSPKASRGRFVCFQLTLLNLGIMIAYWTGYGFAFVDGSKAWRIPVAMQAIFIIPILVLVFIVPESPRWLASHGRSQESLEVLARLQGKPIDHADVVAQHREIQQAVEIEQSLGSGKWSDLLHEDDLKSRRRLIIACAIQFFQQIGGINGLIFYMGNFFALVSDKPALLAGAVFTWFFAASFIPWFLIDSLGRRKLFLACIAGMAAIFAIETGLVYKVQTTNSKVAGGVATAFMFIFMGLFTIGFQANVWCYTAEIQPLRMRQKGASIATACNWITNYAVVQFTPSGIANLGWKFYIIFAVINAAFLPPIYFFFPETKGLSLEAIDLIFAPTAAQEAGEDKLQVAHLEQTNTREGDVELKE
ncbi:hypothetical protein I302_104663 [Kwoniella bestiolae CBS 10118]|uniref:Major facilitator superfamily (MFS) profile domain-containing protein n=1 Tax=Kwoniella bestiolae CBS 10118 TaxID=1296100 RepID=A0A1B9FS36_9TREE|nr:hypothetical protein I302_09268 [Kwoniella bestiolae CBS 10118]OCF21589.1 hypothetical protein I302_09268 [Kwoniella bestiolae CBS 10118]